MAYLLKYNPAEQIEAANDMLERLERIAKKNEEFSDTCTAASEALTGAPRHALLAQARENAEQARASVTTCKSILERIAQSAKDALQGSDSGVLDDVDVEAFEPAPLVVTVADFDEDTEAELAELLENHLHAKDINYSHALYALVNEAVNTGLEGPDLCVSFGVPAGGGTEEILNIEVLLPNQPRASISTWLDANESSVFAGCSTGREVCEMLAGLLNDTIKHARRGLGA